MVKLSWILAIGLATAAAFAGPIDAKTKSAVETQVTARVLNMAYVPGSDFTKWPEILKRYRDQLDKATTEEAFAGSLNTALSEMKVSHLQILTPEQNKTRLEGSRAGLGVYLEVVPQGLKVNGTILDSPADKAGLNEGDLIIKVNGKKPASQTVFQGEVGQEFTLLIRDPKGKERTVKIKRAVFNTKEPETLQWLSGDVAQIRIPTFEQSYSRSNVLNLVNEAQKAKVIVVDMRGNPGGFVFNMLHFAGLVLPKDQPFGTMVNRFVANKFTEETKKPETDLLAFSEWSKDKMKPAVVPNAPKINAKLVAIVDGGTGSAAEIMAAAMRDVGGATVFGQKSVGMVLAALMQDLPGGFMMLVPIQDYITIKGQRLEGTGVSPDITVNGRKTRENDPAKNAILEWVAKQTL